MPKTYFTILFFLLSIVSSGQSDTLIDLSTLNNLKQITSVEELSDIRVDSIVKIELKRERLDTVPLNLFNYPNLQFLDLSRNRLDSLPDGLSKLKNLQVLMIDRNDIRNLPDDIFELKHIKIFLAGGNEFKYINPAIANWSKVEELDFWNTNVDYVPQEIANLENLKKLDLRGISLSVEQQKEILDLFPPEIKIFLSTPCNCGP